MSLARLAPLGVILLAGWAGVAQAAPVPGLLYSTGFEAGGALPFVAGNLHGQNNWTVSEGAAVVQSAVAAHGTQAVQAGPGTFQLNFSAAEPVLWIDGFFLDPGGADPMLPAGTASAVIVFSATSGLLALDGDGAGHGVFVQVAADFPTNRFVRLSLREDFAAKRYDVWLDGALRRAGLGFKDDSVTALSVVQRSAGPASFLDDFSLSTWGLDADSDGDGLNDLDEVKFYGTDPLRFDTDGDGMSDGDEVVAGTDPTDPSSRLALRIDRTDQGQPRLRFPSVTGRLYTLQRRAMLSGEAWQAVPGAADLPGDGLEMEVVETNASPAFFYRAVVTRP